jgi:uncharacterized protein YjiS (DUF1127 family)
MTYHAGNGAVGSTFTLALAGVALRSFRTFVEGVRNRMQVRELLSLDDRALKDIGLMRGDVTAALDLPLHRDPSRHLVDVSGRPRVRARSEAAVTAADLMRLRRPDADVTGARASVARAA